MDHLLIGSPRGSVDRKLVNWNLLGCNLLGCNLLGCNLLGCNLLGCNLLDGGLINYDLINYRRGTFEEVNHSLRLVFQLARRLAGGWYAHPALVATVPLNNPRPRRD